MKKVMFMSLTAAALFLTACGNNQESATAETTDTTEAPAATDAAATSNNIELTGNDQMKFSETEFHVKAGEPITLKFTNVGSLPAESMSHDVVVLQPGSDIAAFGQAVTQAPDMKVENLPADEKAKVVAETKMLGPGESDQITFTLDQAGEYPFLCTFPGHYGSMNGKIIAE